LIHGNVNMKRQYLKSQNLIFIDKEVMEVQEHYHVNLIMV